MSTRFYALTAAALLLILSLPSCAEPDHRARPEPPTATISALPTSTIDSARTTYTPVGSIENASYADVRRFSRRIVVPLGRTDPELRATITRALNDLANESQGDAVTVFAYRPGDPTDGIYSAARGVFAPNGRWEDAELRNAPKAATIEINDLYFANSTGGPVVGDTVALHDDSGESIIVSDNYGAWGDDNAVTHARSGSRAVILERRSEPMGSFDFVRFRVRLIGSGAEGWVHASDTK